MPLENISSDVPGHINLGNGTSISQGIPNPQSEPSHPLLKNARVLESDYRWVRRIAEIWTSIMNVSIGNYRPILAFFSLWSKSHSDYKREIEAISQFPKEEKETLENNIKVYGGETEDEYKKLLKKYPGIHQTTVDFHNKSDSLEAAKQIRDKNSSAKIAIVNFANAVRVGGADSYGGKGSQEEQLLRSTYLRVALEKAYQHSNSETREKTGRYIGYYSAIVSRNVPTLNNLSEKYLFISAAAPDLRTGTHSEGEYFKNQKDSPALVEAILKRKLSVIMTSAVEEKCDTLILGAFGSGAFGNNPETVARIINDLIQTDFNGCFSKVVLPIGKTDKNRSAFEKVFPIKSGN